MAGQPHIPKKGDPKPKKGEVYPQFMSAPASVRPHRPPPHEGDYKPFEKPPEGEQPPRDDAPYLWIDGEWKPVWTDNEDFPEGVPTEED